MRRHGLLIASALALAAVIATSARAHPSTPQIRAEQEHARAVQAQVEQIGRNLEATIERYDGARVVLQQVEAQLKNNTYRLGIARANFHEAQQRILARIYSLYVNGSPTTLDVIAGAHSLSEVIDRAEAAEAISQQDAQLGRQALQFKQVLQTRQHNLTKLRAKRAHAVLTLSAQKRKIEAGLAQQKRLLASIHMTIHQLQVQEAQRLAKIAAERKAAAEERLREQQRAAAAAAAAAKAHQSPGGEHPSPPIYGHGSSHPEAARIALRYLGVPYVWGGASPSGFDCSGLVMYVYAQLGIYLPHNAAMQWSVTEHISSSQMEAGDLVFFDNLGHVGIYLGGGQFINAPHTGSFVRIDRLSDWGSAFYGASRVP